MHPCAPNSEAHALANPRTRTPAHGFADPRRDAIFFTWLCWIGVEIALQALHYLRPGPFGAPFVLDPLRYVPVAAFYGVFAHSIVCAAFLTYTVATRARPVHRPRAFNRTLLVTLVVLTTVGLLDRELQRFMGAHLSFGILRLYGDVAATPKVIWDCLASDRGGAWSGVWMFGAVISAAWWLDRSATRSRIGAARWRASTWAPIALLTLALPAAMWWLVPGGKLRQAKVAPGLMLLGQEVSLAMEPKRAYPSLARSARRFQQLWLEHDSTGAWRFEDPERPMRKRPFDPPATTGARPNVVLLNLETFRAKDMPSFNEAFAGPSPTPFLDELARHPRSAYYPRFVANGVPSIYAFMAMHTGQVPHSRARVATDRTTTRFDTFPAMLRDAGYRSLYATGSDPDWDNQRHWLQRWYDEVYYERADAERDRDTFREAALRIKRLGRSGDPFVATVVSISNHAPFQSPEPELDVDPGHTPIGRLRNTMRYTDDVVREFIESLRGEPWFDRTVFIVTGDHGYDLGDRGAPLGHGNLRHETTWVPLILHGTDPRLPRGRQPRVGSHVDLAPTIAELAEIWAPNSFQGHSLLQPAPKGGMAITVRFRNWALETRERTIVQRRDQPALAYAANDPLHNQPLPSLQPAQWRHARAIVEAVSEVTDYCIDFDRVTD